MESLWMFTLVFHASEGTAIAQDMDEPNILYFFRANFIKLIADITAPTPHHQQSQTYNLHR